MKNLFEEKKWDRDNVKLYKGMLFVNLSGERWVLLDDCINSIRILLGYEKLVTYCDDGTFYYTIEDNNVLVRSKEDSEYKRTITYYELFETTYSDWWNRDLDVNRKQLANALNVATVYNERPIVNLFNNRLWNISNNVVIVEGVMFINVTGDRWYPIADNVSGGFSHNPGEFIFTPNDCGLTKLISVNTKYKTLDIFSLFFNAERNHKYSLTQPLLVKLAQDVVKSKRWQDFHNLLLEELNRYNSSVSLFANNKVEYTYYEDDWGEPVKDGFTKLKNLRDAMRAHLNSDLNEKLVSDNVNAPEHYKLRGLDIEAIDVIRGALTEDEFRGFCKGNVLKYTIREGHKNGDEDLKKAKKYLDFLEKDDSDE